MNRMGRYIFYNPDPENNIQVTDCEVYKYEFAEQNSEMGRIHDELGLGDYRWIRYEPIYTDDEGNWEGLKYVYTSKGDDRAEGDVLTLKQKDLKHLDEQIGLTKAAQQNESEKYYIAMLETIADFMRNRPAQEEFTFVGDF